MGVWHNVAVNREPCTGKEEVVAYSLVLLVEYDVHIEETKINKETHTF